MTRSEINQRVHDFLVSDFEIDEEKIYQDANLKDDIGIDSLDFVDIGVIVNKEFGIKIVNEEMKGIATLGQFCDYIESKINA